MTQIWAPSSPLNLNGSGANGGTDRIEFLGLSGGGTQVRVTLQAGSSTAMQLDHVSIAVLGSATFPNTQAVPTELLFGGVSGVSIAAGASIISDWANLTFASTDTLVLVLDQTAGGPGGFEYNSGTTNANAQYKVSAASYDQATVSGFTALPGWDISVTSIEAQTSSPPPPPTGSDRTLSSFVYAIASGSGNPPGDAFYAGNVLSWATLEMGSGVSGVSWIGQDFGEGNTREINRIDIKQLSTTTAINSVKVQYSDDASTWTDSGTFTISKDDAPNTINVSAGSHRAWRLLANDSPSDRWQVISLRFIGPAPFDAPAPRIQVYGNNASVSITPTAPSESPPYTGLSVAPFDANYYDTQGNYDPSTYKFTASIAGFYRVTISLYFQGTITAGVNGWIFQKRPDGSMAPFIFPFSPQPDGSFSYGITVPMKVGDTLDLRYNVPAGSDVTMNGPKSWMCVDYLGV